MHDVPDVTDLNVDIFGHEQHLFNCAEGRLSCPILPVERAKWEYRLPAALAK